MKNNILFSALLFIFFACNKPKPTEEVQEEIWPSSTFEQERINQSTIDSLIQGIDAGRYGNVDHFLLIKNGKMLLNRSFQNDYNRISQGKSSIIGCGYGTCEDSTAFGDFNYYHPSWHPYYHGRPVHTLQSITKSISSTLIGIAIDQGLIPSTQVKILDYLSDYDLSKVDETLKSATLEDLLTMRLGTEWHEVDRDATDPTNTTFALEQSEDWVQFTLNQPMDTLPGTQWNYNSGASQMMSVIIKKVTGMHLDEYAEKVLFGPLGIEDFYWKHDPSGFPDALGGLYLSPEDLAKIGYLFLNEGDWEGQQVVSKEWVSQATSRITETAFPGYGYGFQWWRPGITDSPVWSGIGFGDQALMVYPELNVVAVVFSWNVFDEEVESIRDATIQTILKANQ